MTKKMITVIGAGPSGLATAYYLQQRGLSYRVLEKHSVAYAWQNHYDSLHLHTLKEVSGLPGLPMPQDYPPFASGEQVHAYLDAYAKHFKLKIEEGVELLNASYDGKWALQTSQGTYESDILLLATGIWSTPYSARFKGQELFKGSISHAKAYKNAQPFIGKRVLVVGAGNSGTEIAARLSEQGIESAIAIRSGTTFVPYPTSPTVVRAAACFFRTFPRPITAPILKALRKDFTHLGILPPDGSLLDAYPVVGYELPEAVERGKVKVYRGIKQFGADYVEFEASPEGGENNQRISFDAVILATGYRPSVQAVAHELEFDSQGYPICRNGRSIRNPNLFCVGFVYPATEGFLQAIGRFARSVVEEIAKEEQGWGEI